MITMAQAEYIKHLWEKEDKPLREIAQITNLNFRTVQKYSKKEDWSGGGGQHVERRYPVLQDYIPIIDRWLEDDLKEPRKQRHTARRIFTRLQDEHRYPGSYSSVRKYVRKKKTQLRQDTQGHMPLAHPPCHAQIDFGQFRYHDGAGNDKDAYALTISFPNSNAAFTQVFRGQNQKCLLEGIKRIFSHTGGVPVRLRADDMRPRASGRGSGAGGRFCPVQAALPL